MRIGRSRSRLRRPDVRGLYICLCLVINVTFILFTNSCNLGDEGVVCERGTADLGREYSDGSVLSIIGIGFMSYPSGI
jgi:hypothetical protein